MTNFTSDFLLYKWHYDQNLPYNKQDIDEIEEERDPDLGDEKEDLQQEQN